MFKGACLCGGVQYEADSDGSMAGICHCTRCQRSSGGGGLPGFLVMPDKFNIVAGADHVHAYEEEGFATRHFCAACGSGVYVSGGEWIVANAGTLEAGSAFNPQFHMMVDHKAAWDVITDDLPQFGEYPPME